MSHQSSDGNVIPGKPRRSCGCQSCRSEFGPPLSETKSREGFKLDDLVPGFQKTWAESLRRTAKGVIRSIGGLPDLEAYAVAVTFEPGNATSYPVLFTWWPRSEGVLGSAGVVSLLWGGNSKVVSLPPHPPSAFYLGEKTGLGTADCAALEVLIRYLMQLTPA